MPHPITGAGTATLEDRYIVIAGGWVDVTGSNRGDTASPTESQVDNPATPGDETGAGARSVVYPLDYAASTIIDEKRKVALGQYSDRVLVYDTVDQTYSWAGGRMPRGPNDVRLCALGSRLYAVGGENIDPTLFNTTNDFIMGEVVSGGGTIV